jgi:hypothetical protein
MKEYSIEVNVSERHENKLVSSGVYTQSVQKKNLLRIIMKIICDHNYTHCSEIFNLK